MSIDIAEGYVYLDWAATAPLCEEALEAMRPYLVAGSQASLVDANANSLHSPGRKAFEALEKARKSLAAALGATRPNEVILTSGATEADNAAIIGLARGQVQERIRSGRACAHPRVVISEIEHEAVAKSAERLAREGFEIAKVPCNRQGRIGPERLSELVDEETVLVSIQAANGEVGSVQPIEELAKIAHGCGALFHTDAVQALGKIPFNADELGVDAATFSAHKICGPKGVGALYLRARTPFDPYALGGGQESGRRSGTQNVCGAVGFAAACEAAVQMQPQESRRQMAMRDKLYARLRAIPGVEATMDVEQGDMAFLPSVVHVLVGGMESETMILRLDQMGFGVSGGSACASHSLEPSHVLKVLGIDADRAFGALRISFGRYTQESDIDRFAEALAACIG